MPNEFLPPPPNADIDFVRFLNSVQNAVADSVNPAFKRGNQASKYASLAVILDTVKTAADSFNIAPNFVITDDPDRERIVIHLSFIHTSGKSFPGGSYPVKVGNLTPQQFGSSLTYARRYLLSTGAGIAVDMDDDGNAASLPFANDRIPPNPHPVKAPPNMPPPKSSGPLFPPKP
jgi:hypothetical protein